MQVPRLTKLQTAAGLAVLALALGVGTLAMAAEKTDEKKVPVTFSGGHETTFPSHDFSTRHVESGE